MTTPIEGVLPIVHTPLDERDQIDWHDFQRQVAWAIEQGANGCCTGMVSELLRLTPNERQELTRRLADAVGPSGVAIASVGAESTIQAVQYARQAERVGCTALMAIPPTSTSLPAEELITYYRSLADSVQLPIVVQDASAYVGQEIPLDVNQRLLELYGPQRILFKPEASPVGPKLSALRDATSGRARVFDGSGGISLIDCYRRGIVGTMPGMEFLDGVVSLWRALQRDDEDAAYRIYFPLCALVTLQVQAGLDGFLAIEKYILVKRGLFKTERRRGPVKWVLDDETRQEVDRLLARLEEATATTS